VILLNAVALVKVYRKNPQTRAWLETWRDVVEKALWQNIIDVRKSYPHADAVSLGRGAAKLVVTIFNVGGNNYRLLTRINYSKQLVQIVQVLTHAEYSKQVWKREFE